MKKLYTALVFFLIAAGCATPPIVPDTEADALMAKAKVEAIHLDLDAPQDYEGAALWKEFANKPFEKQFGDISTEHWFSNWRKYRAHLVEIAQKSGMDAAGLQRCLDKIEPSSRSKTALLPVGAFFASKGSAPVWIIVCKWEIAHQWEQEGKMNYARLGHIRIWAMRASDAKKVDFTTCM